MPDNLAHFWFIRIMWRNFDSPGAFFGARLKFNVLAV